MKIVTKKHSDSVNNNIKPEFVTGGYVLYETETVMMDIKKQCERVSECMHCGEGRMRVI